MSRKLGPYYLSATCTSACRSGAWHETQYTEQRNTEQRRNPEWHETQYTEQRNNEQRRNPERRRNHVCAHTRRMRAFLSSTSLVVTSLVVTSARPNSMPHVVLAPAPRARARNITLSATLASAKLD